MLKYDFHVHTSFSDGDDPPEAVVRAALDAGLGVLGFSDHSYTPFDESCCVPAARLAEYRAEIAGLKARYRGRLRIFCGLEQDYDSAPPDGAYDYLIGSVHYLEAGGEYFPVDLSAAHLMQAAERGFGGDVYAMTEAYFRKVADVVRKTHADVIGHFDLIGKFIEQTPLFDPQHPRYRAAWQAAADALLATGALFELNTGAISRGYRTSPYPSEEILRYLRARGGRFVLSSDSHRASTLCYGFERYRPELPGENQCVENLVAKIMERGN